MTDSETESNDASIQEIEGNDEEVIKSWKRCTKCRRPTIYHEGKCGKNCNLELLDEDQMKQHETSVLQKIKDKNAENKKEQAKSNTGQKSSKAVLDPDIIEGLKKLLANQSKDKNINNLAQNASNLQNSSQFIPTPPWMNMWNQYHWNQWNGPNQQQWNPRQQIPNQQANQQQFQPQQPQYQQQQMQNPTQQFMQPTPVPKFTKNMSLEAWKRKVNVWSVNHVHINESLRLNMILESLKENNERKELQNWIGLLYHTSHMKVGLPNILCHLVHANIQPICWHQPQILCSANILASATNIVCAYTPNKSKVLWKITVILG